LYNTKVSKILQFLSSHGFFHAQNASNPVFGWALPQTSLDELMMLPSLRRWLGRGTPLPYSLPLELWCLDIMAFGISISVPVVNCFTPDCDPHFVNPGSVTVVICWPSSSCSKQQQQKKRLVDKLIELGLSQAFCVL